MKNTKTKLMSSVAVLLICFVMLIGSTFAWFTDSASTGANKIQAGNLDINATISCTSVNSQANGDKCGGIVGHAGNIGVKVQDCTVKDTSISAGRDAGQVVGAAKSANVSNCGATNVRVSLNGTSTGENINNQVIGRILS